MYVCRYCTSLSHEALSCLLLFLVMLWPLLFSGSQWGTAARLLLCKCGSQWGIYESVTKASHLLHYVVMLLCLGLVHPFLLLGFFYLLEWGRPVTVTAFRKNHGSR